MGLKQVVIGSNLHFKINSIFYAENGIEREVENIVRK